MFWELIAQRIFDISLVSFAERVVLTGHYYSVISGAQKEEQTLKQRNYPAHMLAALKTAKHPVSEIAGLRFNVPTTRFEYPLLAYLLTLTENYERGVLPFPGSLSEQPSKVIELIEIIQLVRMEYQNKQQKEN